MKLRRYLLPALAAVFLLSIGMAVGRVSFPKQQPATQKISKAEQYPLLAKRLFSEDSNDTLN